MKTQFNELVSFVDSDEHNFYELHALSFGKHRTKLERAYKSFHKLKPTERLLKAYNKAQVEYGSEEVSMEVLQQRLINSKFALLNFESNK